MDKKSLVIGALGSALLFVTLGASNPVTIQTTVPVEHEWEIEVSNQAETMRAVAYAINKRTGEVRKYSPYLPGKGTAGAAGYYKCVKVN